MNFKQSTNAQHELGKKVGTGFPLVWRKQLFKIKYCCWRKGVGRAMCMAILVPCEGTNYLPLLSVAFLQMLVSLSQNKKINLSVQTAVVSPANSRSQRNLKSCK